MDSPDFLSQTYVQAAETIKTAILQGQYEALKGENRVQLAVYFGVGRFVSQNSRKGTWGSGAIEAISERLRKLLPGLRGFSAESLKKMRQFYENWMFLDSQQPNSTPGGPIDNSVIAITELRKNNQEQERDNQERDKAVHVAETIDIFHGMTIPNSEDFPAAEFLAVPFTHHSRILSKSKILEERYYYIRRCAQEHWSVDTLLRAMKENVYRSTGVLPNNFTQTLSAPAEARKAVMMFKDEYALDFINVEQIGERDADDVDERVVEKQIIQNIKQFIMTFGRDFAFVGNQYRMEAYGVEHFPDLVFFNRELNALVIVELKIGEFKTSYLGQLMGYLTIADDKLRKPHENPAIGIVLCRSANKNYAEYMVRQYAKPMGVATYKTSADMPENLRKALPALEELKRLL